MRKITEIKYQVMYQLKIGSRYYTKSFYTYEQAINYAAKQECTGASSVIIYVITKTKEQLWNSDYRKEIFGE